MPANSECNCGPGISTRKKDCRRRCSAPLAGPRLRRCIVCRSRGTAWCAPRPRACPDLCAECREIADACRPWRFAAAPLSGAAQVFQQRIDGGGLGFDDPESADVGPKIVEQLRAPGAAGGFRMLLDESAQMLDMRAHAFGRDAVDVDQFVVVAVDEVAFHVEHIGKSAGEAGAE